MEKQGLRGRKPKPHLQKARQSPLWGCTGGGQKAYGKSLKEAYFLWENKMVLDAAPATYEQFFPSADLVPGRG